MSVPPDDMRLTGRALGEFILRWAELAAPNFGGDLVTAVIYTAVIQANVREIWNDSELNRQYSADAPPDALRRPISVSSIAASLNLPRETVRRHVTKMLETGAMVKKDGGVMVPRAVVDSPQGLESMRLQYANVRRFVLALRRAGVSFAEADQD
ncbi:MAG: hypothetical protein EON95_05950 [Caulobacteraceae bacterium]|nr:MAG: hypothetical protein EON95_05950 [Caulobacteraceae bacterium]